MNGAWHGMAPQEHKVDKMSLSVSEVVEGKQMILLHIW